MLGKKLINSGPTSSGANTFASENFNTVIYTGNGSTQRIGGYINRGAVFNGSSAKIDLPNLGLSGADTRSISAWIKVNSLSAAQTIFQFGASAAKQRFGFAIDTSGKLYVEYYGRDAITSSAHITVNTWFHVAVTYNGGAIETGTNTQIYVDGSAVTMTTTGSSTGTANTTNSAYGIGYRRPSTTQYFNGTIDQVRIFDKALSSSEITTLNGETHASTTISTTDIFNDNSGIALYQLDGNANDTGGGSGKFGSAAIFNGSSSVIQASGLNQFFNNWNDASWSAWINTTDTSAQYIACESTDSQNYKLIGSISSNKFQIVVRRSGTVYSGTSTTTMNDGNWHQIVATYESSTGTVKGYIDGSEEISFSTGGTSSATFSVYDFCIGANKQGSNVYNPLDGRIDDVRIYSDVLTSTEVGYIYNNTTASIPTDNLEAYYKLNGNAVDEQGSYNGTASNVIYKYDGTASNVTYQEATKFTPDLVWIKKRSSSTSSDHVLNDSVRGANKILYPNLTNGEDTAGGAGSAYFNSFDSNGFTVGSSTYYNGSGETYVAWCFNAGSGSSGSNTDGTITSTVKANTAAGFSIVKYTGNSSYGQTVGHGLGVEPKLVIIKNRDNARNWRTYVSALGATKYINLDESAASGTYGSFNDTAPTTDVFSTTSSGAADRATNYANDNYIAYCFADVTGYQKIGSYTGNGSSSSGPIIETGFEPAFLMIKVRDINDSWFMVDNKREATNPRGDRLFANSSAAEASEPGAQVNFLANGFQITGSGGGQGQVNSINQTYIYLAIAADPDQTDPTVENSFSPILWSGTGSARSVTGLGFKPDLLWWKGRNVGYNWKAVDSINGPTKNVYNNLTNSLASDVGTTSFDDDGFTFGSSGNGNASGVNYVGYAWKAGDHDDSIPQINTEGTIDSIVSVNDAAGFSIVKYTSTGTNGSTIGHGLSAAPDLVIIKCISTTGNWIVYNSASGTGKYLYLNSASSEQSSSWFGTSATTFTLNNTFNDANTNGRTYIAYCWYSVTGYSKIATFAGTNYTNAISGLGFAPRFVMIKNSTGSGPWVVHSKPPATTNPSANHLRVNSSGQEDSGAGEQINFDSDGFTINYNGCGNINCASNTFLYMAFK